MRDLICDVINYCGYCSLATFTGDVIPWFTE